MIDNAGKLLIFENFQSDRSLPKFRKDDKYLNPSTYTVMGAEDSDSMTIQVTPNRSWRTTAHLVPLQRPDSWFGRLIWRVKLARLIGFSKVLAWLFGKSEQTESMPIEQFFASVRNSAKQLELVTSRASGYEQAMIRAKKAGQTALLEQLADGLNAYKMETQLAAIEMSKYVSEEDVVRFYKQSKRGLRLDWVRNFVRQIPQEVLDRKEKADEIGIFDNYAVLHYDPQAKSFAETQEEKNRRKDPILFGLISGRRRLYFVGDWKDEMCDLTLDQIADALGKDVVKDTASEEIR